MPRVTRRCSTRTTASALFPPRLAVTVYTPGVSATNAPAASIWATAALAAPLAATAHSTGTSPIARPRASFAFTVNRMTSPVRTALDAGSTASRVIAPATTCTGSCSVAGPAFAVRVTRPGASACHVDARCRFGQDVDHRIPEHLALLTRDERDRRDPHVTVVPALDEPRRIDVAFGVPGVPGDRGPGHGLAARVQRPCGEPHGLADLDLRRGGRDLHLGDRKGRRRRRVLQQCEQDRDMHANSLWYNWLRRFDPHYPQP